MLIETCLVSSTSTVNCVDFEAMFLRAFYALGEMTNVHTFALPLERLRARTRLRYDEFRGNEGDDTTFTSSKQHHFFSPILVDGRSPSRAHKAFDETSPLAIHARGFQNRASVRTEHRERCLGWRPASVQDIHTLPDVHGERHMRGE